MQSQPSVNSLAALMNKITATQNESEFTKAVVLMQVLSILI